LPEYARARSYDFNVSKPFVITFGAAVVVIAALIWLGFARTEGNHLVPTGSIGKVRTAQSSDETTFMVIDFKIKNDSDVAMVVHSIEASIDLPDGSTAPGSAAASGDLPMAFRNYTLLGEQYNPVLKDRDTIPAHQEVDRMVGVSFDLPFDRVEKRKDVKLRIEDVTGPAVEMTK
jgi:hypothetical protein